MELNTGGMIGQSTTLASVFKVLGKVAPTDSTVLVTGESGTGKELLVRALHANSRRAAKPFVPINCGAIPKELLESELFGHEKGAFTHAIRSRPGRFELADGGTVFLDEIGEMDLSLQVKILRVLQEKEIERVGGNGAKKVDVRIVAATNRDLENEVAAGHFREDLYYRLNVIPLHLPPLRERGGDVLLLARNFLERFCGKKSRALLKFAPVVEKILTAYDWPGNVRELENVMERLSILTDGDVVQPADMPPKILDRLGDIAVLADEAAAGTPEESGPDISTPALAAVAREQTETPAQTSAGGLVWPVLADLERTGMDLKAFLETAENRLINEALAKAGNVKNLAAEFLGIKRTTLIEKLRKRNMP
ncbi:MAG: sigma-54 dependent transcriptional regulator [Desulfovibrio sp.]|jgi:transcriptional regulator with GAF, ATPase, and Fis domain|nr:sigma-54 dependent transcriptional regulator [Desulfovibrio sp.]